MFLINNIFRVFVFYDFNEISSVIFLDILLKGPSKIFLYLIIFSLHFSISLLVFF